MQCKRSARTLSACTEGLRLDLTAVTLWKRVLGQAPEDGQGCFGQRNGQPFWLSVYHLREALNCVNVRVPSSRSMCPPAACVCGAERTLRKCCQLRNRHMWWWGGGLGTRAARGCAGTGGKPDAMRETPCSMAFLALPDLSGSQPLFTAPWRNGYVKNLQINRTAQFL